MSDPAFSLRLTRGALIADKYRLISELGRGAMGVVWAATNEATGRQVALKLLVRSDSELRHRFLREARSYGALQHPNIVDILDVVRTESGDPCLVMERLSGESVAALLGERRRLDAPLAARIGRDVACALTAAHAVYIVHRDLKPSNVFLHRPPRGGDFVVKVLDFGVAKNLAGPDGLQTTGSGIVGSPLYMSPEQARAAADVDHRADLWALGVMLFEMLAGVRPFPGERPELLAQIVSGDIPKLSRFLRHADPRLVEIVDRCLRRDPDERLAAEEVAGLLDRVVSPELSTTAPLPGASLTTGRGTSIMPAVDAGAPPRASVSTPAPEVMLTPRGTVKTSPEAMDARRRAVLEASAAAMTPGAGSTTPLVRSRDDARGQGAVPRRTRVKIALLAGVVAAGALITVGLAGPLAGLRDGASAPGTVVSEGASTTPAVTQGAGAPAASEPAPPAATGMTGAAPAAPAPAPDLGTAEVLPAPAEAMKTGAPEAAAKRTEPATPVTAAAARPALPAGGPRPPKATKIDVIYDPEPAPPRTEDPYDVRRSVAKDVHDPRPPAPSALPKKSAMSPARPL